MRRSCLGLLLLGAHAQPDIPVAGGKYVLSAAGDIRVPVNPGFTALPEQEPGKLFITSFEATPFIGKNGVFVVDVAGNSSGPVELLPGTDKINWPNTMTGVDPEVFGFPALVVGNGFLVPSHATGGVYVLEASARPSKLKAPVKITADKPGWFYHQGALMDLDGDGLKDIVTSRCKFGILPWDQQKAGELVWLKQPAAGALSGQAWEEFHLGDGPDFLFCVQPGTKRLALVAPEFVGEKMVYWYMKEDGSMASRVLDAKSGPGFSCSWIDLNGDGRLELLATNHAAANGSVYAYSFDGEDFSTAPVTRHELATGFTPVKPGAGQASPGDAVAFRPQAAHGGKPHILLSGDNSNSIFLLVPDSESRESWSYTTQPLGSLGADVGRPTVGDVDGDGFADVFVPAYDAKKVMRYKFHAAAGQTDLVMV